MKKGKLIIISGFSGVGKGTIVKELVSKYDDIALSISATTRQPRTGEVDGVHYFFKTKEEFEEMIEAGKLLEYAKYVDNYYGTPLEFVEKQRDKGINVILEIEMQGATKVKDMVKDVNLIFVLPPSAETLKNRLIGRGTETEDVVNKRLKRAAEETSFVDQYDTWVVNDDLQECVQDIRNIIDDNFDNEPSKGFIDTIKSEIVAMSNEL